MTIALWFGVSTLLLASLVIIWWPFAKQGQISLAVKNVRSHANTQSYRVSLEKLDTQLQEERLSNAQYQSLKAELGRKLLQDEADKEEALHIRKHSILLPIFLTLSLIGGSIFFYLNVGASAQLVQVEQRDSELKAQNQQFMQALTQLERQVLNNPTDTELLFNLAHFYIAAQQFDNAISAFKKLISIEGEYAEFIGPQAQALYYKNDQKITPQITSLIKRALELDANDVSTLTLLGLDSYANGDYVKAINFWQRILNNNRYGTDTTKLVGAINSAKQRLIELGEPLPEESKTTPLISAGVIAHVSISKALQHDFSTDSTLFIYAIALEGPRMPLAAIKMTAGQLPKTITLTDVNAMTSNGKISQHEKVRLFAVISQAGTPGIKPGDLHGELTNVSTSHNKPYQLVIDKVAK